jgi:hypothetical protein
MRRLLSLPYYCLAGGYLAPQFIAGFVYPNAGLALLPFPHPVSYGSHARARGTGDVLLLFPLKAVKALGKA